MSERTTTSDKTTMVSLSIYEMASLLTHADRSTATKVDLASIMPWDKWLMFCREFAMERGFLQEVPEQGDPEVGHIYRCYERRRGEKWLVVTKVGPGVAECEAWRLNDKGFLIKDKRPHSARFETLAVEANQYVRVRALGEGAVAKFVGVWRDPPTIAEDERPSVAEGDAPLLPASAASPGAEGSPSDAEGGANDSRDSDLPPPITFGKSDSLFAGLELSAEPTRLAIIEAEEIP